MKMKRKKLTITFTDFVNWDYNGITTAVLNKEDIYCNKCRQGAGEDSNEDDEEKQPVPTFGAADAGS